MKTNNRPLYGPNNTSRPLTITDTATKNTKSAGHTWPGLRIRATFGILIALLMISAWATTLPGLLR